jgi:hypothetical protein
MTLREMLNATLEKLLKPMNEILRRLDRIEAGQLRIEKMLQGQPLLVRVDYVAERVGVGQKRAYDIMHEIGVIHLKGGDVAVLLDDLEEYLRQRRAA